MFKNYFVLAWRNLQKHKTSAMINIGGLALGLTTSILVMLFLMNEFSFDRFHKNIPDLYLLMKNQKQADGVSTGRSSAGPIALALRTQLPEVDNSVREAGKGTLARIGDKQLPIEGIYTDTGFFSMMSFPSIDGNPAAALRDEKAIILTESTAKRLFGTDKAMGATFIIDDTVPVTVSAILKDPPSNSSLRFDYIRPFAPFERQNSWLKKWDDNRIQTWLQLKPGADKSAFDKKATAMLQTRSNDTTVSTFAVPMASLRLHSGFDNGKQKGGKIYIVSLIALLGFFVLVIACINFMNIATARSEVRAREVGVRKVMGASRRQVMMQFFCEALTITFLSLMVGVVVSQAVLPLFNRYMDTNIHFDGFDWRSWAGIACIGLLTGLIAGSYPALFLSRFMPARVLKGEITVGKKRALLRRALVTTQFWVAILFIIATIVVWQEIDYVKNRPLGYSQQDLIDVHASADLGAKYQLFTNQVGKLPGVKDISAGSDNLTNFGSGITGMDWPGKIPGQEISILITSVEYNWIKTTKMTLAEGRDFDPAFGTDTSACLVNESTVQKLGLQKPVLGQKLGGSTIIGVVKNFVFNNPSGIIAPMAIYLYKEAPTGGHFFVRIANDQQGRQTIASIADIVRKLDPKHGFDYNFTTEDYEQRYAEMASYGACATIFGGMAIFISCLGLIGLAAFVAERRSKEMSIRKVFGASVRQVMLLLSLDFIRPVIIAFVFAVPVAAWALHVWLNNIAYHVSLSYTVFLTGGVIALGIALITVGLQGARTANENPAKKLRNE
jgi:ABC-type antimicrobial peptide transport system permease subunit